MRVLLAIQLSRKRVGKVSFVVPGQPQSKQRHRDLVMKVCAKCHKPTPRNDCPRCGKTLWVSAYSVQYTPKETKEYETSVGTFAGVNEPLVVPAVLTVTAYFQIAESRKKKLSERDIHCQRPDASNVLKSIEDGMNRVVVRDDSLFHELHVYKRWSATPRAEVEVEY